MATHERATKEVNMSSRGEKGIQSVLRKLELSLKARKFYEAHQMYRTLYFRYLSKKKYGDLIKLLTDGAGTLLREEQFGSGVDLAILLVDVLSKSGEEPNEWVEVLSGLFKLIPPVIPEREKYLATATIWLTGVNTDDGRRLPNAEWHTRVAKILWDEKNYTQSHQHYKLTSDGLVYAKMLVRLHIINSYEPDVDIFIAKEVLQFLCGNNYPMAYSVYKEYLVEHPTLRKLKEPPFNTYPLLNFLQSLLEIINRVDRAKYVKFREASSAEIARDPSFSKYMDKIGRYWFSIPAPGEQLQEAGLVGFIRTLMSEMDHESTEDGRSLTAAPVQTAAKLSFPEVPDLD